MAHKREERGDYDPLEEIAAGIGALMRARRAVSVDAGDRLVLAAKCAALAADKLAEQLGEERVLSRRHGRKVACTAQEQAESKELLHPIPGALLDAIRAWMAANERAPGEEIAGWLDGRTRLAAPEMIRTVAEGVGFELISE